MSSTETDRRTYLTILFDELEGDIEVRPISDNGPRPAFCESVDAAMVEVERAEANAWNVYVGVATRGKGLNDKGEQSGAGDNLVACRVLWIDKDKLLLEEGALEEWEVLLEQFPLKPSLRVWSGNGQHLYWLLAEPIDLSSEANRRDLSFILKGLVDYFDADRAVVDSPRIMRVPGTTNRKPGVETPCYIMGSTGEVFDIDDFLSFGERGKALDSTPTTSRAVTTGEKRYGEGDRHEALKRHCAYLRKGGLSGVAIEAALQAFNAEFCDPPKAESEVTSLVDWAMAHVEKAEPFRQRRSDSPPEPEWLSADAPISEAEARAFEPILVAIVDPFEPLPFGRVREILQGIGSETGAALTVIDKSRRLEGRSIQLAPRFKLGFGHLHGYGLVGLVGDPGVGKSMIALQIAYNCTGQGMRSIYFDSELDEGEATIRFDRLDRNRTFAAEDEAMRLVTVRTGARLMEAILAQIIEHSRDGTPTLVVIDSINTIAKMTTEIGENSLQSTERLWDLVTSIRRETRGLVSFLIVSEKNAQGYLKGRSGQYAADLVLDLKREGSIWSTDADQTEMPVVSVEITKSRAERGRDFKGVLDWRTGRLTASAGV